MQINYFYAKYEKLYLKKNGQLRTLLFLSNQAGLIFLRIRVKPIGTEDISLVIWAPSYMRSSYLFLIGIPTYLNWRGERVSSNFCWNYFNLLVNLSNSLVSSNKRQHRRFRNLSCPPFLSGISSFKVMFVGCAKNN